MAKDNKRYYSFLVGYVNTLITILYRIRLYIRDVQHAAPHPPPNFTVLYLKFKLGQKYSFRHKTAKFNDRKRTLQVCQMQPHVEHFCFRYTTCIDPDLGAAEQRTCLILQPKLCLGMRVPSTYMDPYHRSTGIPVRVDVNTFDRNLNL